MGTIDAKLVGTGWRKTNRRAADTADTGADTAQNVRTQVSAPRKSEEPPPAPATHLLIDGDSDLDAFVVNLLAGRFASINEAERIKENALALKHVLTARREAGALIEIETAEAVIFEVFRATRDAWLNWPVRVGPLVAADLGLDADTVTGVLTKHVHQQLVDLGEPAPDFTSTEG